MAGLLVLTPGISTSDEYKPFFQVQVQSIYSPAWFVCWTKWRIRCYDWSDRLSVKLPAKRVN